MPEFDLWPDLQHLGDPQEVFVALRGVVGGPGTGTPNRPRFGPWPDATGVVFEPRISNKDRPIVASSAQLSDSRRRELVTACAEALASRAGWLTIAMEVSARPTGAFVHADLQVRPVPDVEEYLLDDVHAPFWNEELEHQPHLRPLLVDLKFEVPNSPFVKTMRLLRAAADAEGMVSLGLWPSPGSLRRSRKMGFCTVWDKLTQKLKSARLFRGFYHPDLEGLPRDSPPAVESADRLPTVEPQRFANGPVDLEPVGNLWVSCAFGQMLDARRGLDSSLSRKFSRSLHWFVEGQNCDSSTMRVVSFASAIEALLPDATQEPCWSCGQPKYGISRAFNDFVERYAKTPDSAQFLPLVYKARSKIVHGDIVHEVDQPMFALHTTSWRDSLVAWSVTRRGLINWLLEQSLTSTSPQAAQSRPSDEP